MFCWQTARFCLVVGGGGVCGGGGRRDVAHAALGLAPAWAPAGADTVPLSLQLFIGTLLFTVLLFLLPTTALYYLVFTLVSRETHSAAGIARGPG